MGKILFKNMKVSQICLFVLLASSAIVNASSRRLLHYQKGELDKSDCPKGMRQYTQYCHELPNGKFKAGKHSGNCKNIKAALIELKCMKRRLAPKKAPTATK